MGVSGWGSSEAGLLRVVDGFYAAALGEGTWTSVLKEITAYFGGVGSVLFDLDRGSGRIGSWIDYGLDQGRDEYAAHAHSINPRMKFSLAHPAGHVAWESRFITEREMKRHEFYDWLRKTSDIGYFMGSRLYDVGAVSVFTSVEFSQAHGHVSDRDLALYRLLTGHIANAWRLRERVDPAQRDLDRIVFATDATPWGVIVLDGTGRIIEINREGERILSAGDILRLENGELHAWQAAADRTLHALIAAAANCARQASCETGGALVISHPGGLPGYSVQIMPCMRLRGAPPHRPAVIIYLSDLANDRGVGPAELRALFGLSEREADLAALLGRGRPLAEAADRLGISRNTARNHLQSIFAKTLTHSQVELVRLIMRVVPR